MNLEADESQRFIFLQNNGDGTCTITWNHPGIGLTKKIMTRELGNLEMPPATQEEIDRFNETIVDIPDNIPGV